MPMQRKDLSVDVYVVEQSIHSYRCMKSDCGTSVRKHQAFWLNASFLTIHKLCQCRVKLEQAIINKPFQRFIRGDIRLIVILSTKIVENFTLKTWKLISVVSMEVPLLTKAYKSFSAICQLLPIPIWIEQRWDLPAIVHVQVSLCETATTSSSAS